MPGSARAPRRINTESGTRRSPILSSERMSGTCRKRSTGRPWNVRPRPWSARMISWRFKAPVARRAEPRVPLPDLRGVTPTTFLRMKSPVMASCGIWCERSSARSSTSGAAGVSPKPWPHYSSGGRVRRLEPRRPPTACTSSVWIIINRLSDEELLCRSLVSASSGQDRADDTFRLARDERCRHHQHKRVLGLSRVA